MLERTDLPGKLSPALSDELGGALASALALLFVALERRGALPGGRVRVELAGLDANGLGQGDHGPTVARWQTFLNTEGARLAVDGKFGPLTAAATERWAGARGARSSRVTEALWTEAFGAGGFALEVGADALRVVTYGPGAQTVERAEPIGEPHAVAAAILAALSKELDP